MDLEDRYIYNEERYVWMKIQNIKYFIYQDAERGEFQCHQNHNEWEDYLETWWKMVICLP